MMKCYVFICLLFTCVFDCGVECVLRVVPNNTAVVVDDTAVFNCSTDNNNAVQWILDGLPTDTPPVTIYDGTSIHPDYSDRYSIVSADSGQFDLQLVNTSLRDAGVYICVELDAAEAVNASAIFTVIAGEPNCSSSAVHEGSAEGDEVALVCVVGFNGTAWQRPRMAWFLEGQLVTNHTQVGSKDVLVWSWCNFTAELPTTDAYTCETYFTAPELSTDHTPNLSQTVPTLTLNWTSPVVAVLYPPANISVSGAVTNATLVFNSELSCASSGQPEPSYYWTDVDVNDIGSRIVGYNGSRFNLTRPGWRQVNCTAYNYIHGVLNSEQASLTLTVLGLTTVPVNTAVVAGQNATLHCQTNSGGSVEWILDGLPNDIPPVLLFDGTSIHEDFTYRYSILPSVGGQYDLRLTNASMRDAGVYLCKDINTTHTASAIFTVLAGEPNCSSSAVSEGSVEGDEVALVCVVGFNGTAWQRPRMTWFLEGQLVTNHTQVGSKDVLVWSWCNFTAELPTTDAYTCETYFSTPASSTDHPPNLSPTAPTLTLNWTSPVVAVLSPYPPINTTISGAVSDQSIELNSVLSCTSNSLPEPSFHWTDTDTNGGSQVTHNGSQLTLTRSGWRQVTCTAYNYVHTELSEQQATVKINVIGSTGLSGGEIAGIVIGTLCAVALIAAGVWYFVYYKRKEDGTPHFPLE